MSVVKKRLRTLAYTILFFAAIDTTQYKNTFFKAFMLLYQVLLGSIFLDCLSPLKLILKGRSYPSLQLSVLVLVVLSIFIRLVFFTFDFCPIFSRISLTFIIRAYRSFGFFTASIVQIIDLQF